MIKRRAALRWVLYSPTSGKVDGALADGVGLSHVVAVVSGEALDVGTRLSLP